MTSSRPRSRFATATRLAHATLVAFAALLGGCGSSPPPAATGERASDRPAEGPNAPGVAGQDLPRWQAVVPAPTRASANNGVRYLALREASSQLAHVVAVVRAGRIYEPRARTGLARVTAALLRHGGTTALPAEAVENRLRAIGASITVDVSADIVAFQASCPAASLPEIVELLSGMLTEPSLTAPNLARAKEQVLKGGADQPIEAWLLGAEIDQRPIDVQVRDITLPDAINFHGLHYRPQRAAIAVCTPLVEATALATVRRGFEPWRAEGPGPERVRQLPPAGSVSWCARDGATADLAVVLALPSPGADRTVEGEALLQCLTTDGIGGRLARELYNANLGTDVILRRRGPLTGAPVVAELSVPAAQSTAAAAALHAAIKSLADDPPSPPETAAALLRARSEILRAVATPARQLLVEATLDVLGLPPNRLREMLQETDLLGPAGLRSAVRDVRGFSACYLVRGGKPPDGSREIQVAWLTRGAEHEGSGAPTSESRRGSDARSAALLAQAARALGGEPAIARVEALAIKRAVRGPMQIRIDEDWMLRWPDRARLVRTILLTKVTTVVNGERGSESTPRKTIDLTKEEAQSLAAAFKRHPIGVLKRWLTDKPSTRWLHEETVEGRPWQVIEIEFPGERPWRITIDGEHGLIRRVSAPIWRTGRGWIEAEEEQQDYRPVGDLRLPHRTLLTLEGEFVAEGDVLELDVIAPPSDTWFDPTSRPATRTATPPGPAANQAATPPRGSK